MTYWEGLKSLLSLYLLHIQSRRYVGFSIVPSPYAFEMRIFAPIKSQNSTLYTI